MALAVDFSRAPRSPTELLALVQAVFGAPTGEPETDYIEWKGLWDLREQVGHRFAAAKHILGFANRAVDRAAAQLDGCAYILAGVEPQNAPGVPQEDPATLSDWFGAYVGTHGPQWSLHWVALNDVKVLVIIVEAPRWGDPIRTLQKPYNHAASGHIFVRRHGQTEQASPAEVHMLEERYKRGTDRIGATVAFVGPPRPVSAYTAELVDRAAWLDAEARRLLAPLERWELAQNAAREAPSAVGTALASALQNAIGFIGRRTPDRYRQEVAEYIARADSCWQVSVWEGIVDRRLAQLQVAIENGTEANYADVEVELLLPVGVRGFRDADHAAESLEVPIPPPLWGEPTGGAYLAASIRPLDLGPRFAPRPASVWSGDRWMLRFAPVNIRPYGVEPLPLVYLAIPHDLVTDDSIELAWRATSTSALDRVAGSLRLPVFPQPVPMGSYPADAAR